MTVQSRLKSRLISLVFLFICGMALAAPPGGSPGSNKGGNTGSGGLSTISSRDWGETPVRKILRAFAFGGLATDEQIELWAAMNPEDAIQEILTFDPVNDLLSPVPVDLDVSYMFCDSLADIQDFWSDTVTGNEADNAMKYADRYRYATVNTSTSPSLSTGNLQRAWTKVISTRGCNPFLHKMAFYLTNYHASISAHKTRAALIRAYYDDVLAELIATGDFVEVMTVAGSHAAVARAYGHQSSRFNNWRGMFFGTDDFGREFHQLLFRIQGTTEDEAYHEDTTIEHTAWLLTGMGLDRVEDSYGSDRSYEWWVPGLDYGDHQYTLGTTNYNVNNYTNHYHSGQGSGSCLEVLHTEICGANAGDKIAMLAPIAAAHPESLDNVPVYMIDFFADDNLDSSKIAAIRAEWVNSNFDILAFLRAYAISTAYHNSSTFKNYTAFDRNLIIQNANILNNEENFAKNYYDSPIYRMAEQGAEVFDPAHDVFGGQTGLQAANNRYIFKDAFWTNTENPTFLDDYSDTYTLADGGDVLTWQKNWAGVIPPNSNNEYVAGEVAAWLWNRFIGDGGKNFDAIARAQVQSILATYRDFGYAMDSGNPDAAYSSNDITKKKGIARLKNEEHAVFVMDELSQKNFNLRVGLAVNFITMLPYAFAMEGK